MHLPFIAAHRALCARLATLTRLTPAKAAKHEDDVPMPSVIEPIAKNTAQTNENAQRCCELALECKCCEHGASPLKKALSSMALTFNKEVITEQ
jgi:hypothetical protein